MKVGVKVGVVFTTLVPLYYMAKLTVKQLESLKSTDIGRVLFDGNGLYGKISNQRTGIVVSFECRYSLNKRKRHAGCGKWPNHSLKEIRHTRDCVKQQVESGIDPVDQRKLERIQKRVELAQAEQRHKEELARIAKEIALKRTFSDAVEYWAKHALNRRKDKGVETLRAINKDITPSLKNVALADVTRASLVDLLDQVVQRGSKVMANHLFSDLSQLFTFAVAREWIEVSPLNGIKKSNVGGRPTERDRVLSAEEIKELAKKLPTANLQHTTVCAIWIMLSTGCRVGELTQSSWESIDVAAQEWLIPPSNTKNGKEHRIYLSPFATNQFQCLSEFTSGYSNWCFPARDPEKHANLKSISKQIRDRTRSEVLDKRSNAAGTLILSGGAWTPHDLRRTAATTMAEIGVASDIIKRCLNQSEDDKLKRVYQHYPFNDEKRQAWESLGAHLHNLHPLQGNSQLDINGVSN